MAGSSGGGEAEGGGDEDEDPGMLSLALDSPRGGRAGENARKCVAGIEQLKALYLSSSEAIRDQVRVKG